eukprot:487088-Rhodomonas_salina.2
MLNDDYKAEVRLLVMNKTDLHTHYQNLCGIAIIRDHWDRLASVVWKHGAAAGLRFVDITLRKAAQFEFEDVVKAVGTASFTVTEMNAVLSALHKSLDYSVANIRRTVADVLEEDAEVVLDKSSNVDIKLQTQPTEYGSESHEALLCSFCGSMFLETENAKSGACCDIRKMCCFRLKPIPAEIIEEMDARRKHYDKFCDKRISTLI